MGGLGGLREVGLMNSSRCLTAPCPGWRVSAGDKVTVGLSLLYHCCLPLTAALLSVLIECNYEKKKSVSVPLLCEV